MVNAKKKERRKGTGEEQMHRYEKSAADLWDSGLRTAVELVLKAEPRAHSLRAPTQEPPVKSQEPLGCVLVSWLGQ